MDWPLWALAGLCIWLGLAFALAPPIGRFLRGPRDTFADEHSDRERLGISDFDGRDRQVRGAGYDEPTSEVGAQTARNKRALSQAVVAENATGPPSEINFLEADRTERELRVERALARHEGRRAA